MSRFTIFSIIFSISIITVMADLVIRDYFGQNATAQPASVLSSSEPTAATVLPLPPPTPLATPAPIEPVSPSPVTAVLAPVPSNVTEEKLHSAGFTGKVAEKPFSGKLYQLVDITTVPVESISFYEISQDVGTVASVTEITLKDEIRALQMYSLLQNKTKTYIDLSLNETNAYGERSFYINHAKKTQEAFLTVKIGKTLYAFAYVKFYHPEIKKLIQLLSP